MKISHKKSPLKVSLKKKISFLIMDEYQYHMTGFSPELSLIRSSNSDQMIVTQAIYQPRGKKVRFLSSVRSERTGLPMHSEPKKFLPAQVVRRLNGR